MQCFEPEVYYAIIASIMVFSVVTSLNKQSLMSFFATFWSYLIVILSDYIPGKAVTEFDRILSGTWLLACTVILAAFSGQLREMMIKPKSVNWIDNWKDLLEWKHIQIQTGPTSEINTYINNFPNDTMSQNFKSRLNLITNESSLGFNFDLEEVKAGRFAIIGPYDILQFTKKKLIADDYREDIDFHISRSERGQPYFSLINRVNDTLNLIFDRA